MNHEQPEQSELCKKIVKTITQDPGQVPELLKAVSQGIEQFVLLQQRKRDVVAYTAVSSLLALYKPPKKTDLDLVPYLIDVAFHQFPVGPSGHAPCDMRFWQFFISQARQHELDRDWLTARKGLEYVWWWDKFVAPALKIN